MIIKEIRKKKGRTISDPAFQQLNRFKYYSGHPRYITDSILLVKMDTKNQLAFFCSVISSVEVSSDIKLKGYGLVKGSRY